MEKYLSTLTRDHEVPALTTGEQKQPFRRIFLIDDHRRGAKLPMFGDRKHRVEFVLRQSRQEAGSKPIGKGDVLVSGENLHTQFTRFSFPRSAMFLENTLCAGGYRRPPSSAALAFTALTRFRRCSRRPATPKEWQRPSWENRQHRHSFQSPQQTIERPDGPELRVVEWKRCERLRQLRLRDQFQEARENPVQGRPKRQTVRLQVWP